MTTDTENTEALAEIDALWDRVDALEAETLELRNTIREKAIAIAPYKVGDELMNGSKRVRVASVSTRSYRGMYGPSYEYKVNRMKKDGTYGTGVFNLYGRVEPVTPE